MNLTKLLLIIVAVLMLFVTIQSASAALTTNIYQHFKCDNATISGVTTIDTTQNQNGTLVNGVTQNSTGFINQSHQTDGVNQYINANNVLNQAQSFSICVWTYLDIQNNDEYIMRQSCPAGGNWAHLYAPNVAGVYRFGTFDANWDNADSTTAIKQGQWVHVCGVHDTTANTNVIYINGTNETRVYNANNLGGTSNHCYGIGGAGKYWDGKLDEITLFRNRALNASAVFDIYNATLHGTSYPWAPAGAANDTINLSADPFPIRAQYNTNPVNVWATANASANWTCRVYVNGTLNQTRNMISGTNVNCSFNLTMSSVGTWSYYIRGNTSNTDENTTNGTIFYDNVNPVITVLNWTNGTVYYNTNVTGQWNITDNFYIHRVTVWYDGLLIQNTTDINQTNYVYNLSRAPGPPNAVKTVTIQVADGHTSKTIPEYDWTNGLFNDYLQYNFNDNQFFKIESIDGSILDSYKTIKEKDRYTFSYEPWDDTKKVYDFLITSANKLHLVKRPKYQEWLISGDHWLDFVGDDNRDIKITMLDDYRATVQISNLSDAKKIMFNSLGDLNIVTQNYTFVTTNMTLTYSSMVNELELQTSTLTIYKPGTITNTSASFTWNGTFYNVTADRTNATYDFYNITFLTPLINQSIFNTQIVWFYNITGTINNLTGNLTVNQSVIQIGIDNCSVYTVRAINMSIRDESNDSLVTGFINGYFEVWISSINQYRAFNLSWVGNSTYGLCINNASLTYYTNGQLEYGATGYTDKNYFLNNISLDNTTNILNLYLTRNTTQVTLTVTDQDDDALQNVFIHIQSYDLGTNSFITTEIVRTDFIGQAFAQMILNTQWYQFMLVYNNSVVLQTDATKQTTTARSFQINLEPNIMSEYDQVQTAVCNVSYNPASNNFRLDFLFPTSNTLTATLSIYNQSTYSTTLLNTSSLTASSGTILINIAPVQNITYLAKSFITIDGTQYSCGILSRTFGHDKDTWGLDGLFMAVFLLIFVVMATIWSPAIAVITTLFVVILTTVLGIFYLSWPYLITLIIIGGIAVYRLAKNR